MKKRGELVLVIMLSLLSIGTVLSSEIKPIQPTQSVCTLLNETLRSYDITYSNEEFVVRQVSLFFDHPLNTTFTVEQPGNNLLLLSPGDAIAYFKIESPDETSIAKAEITLRINQESIKEDLTIKHYKGYWEEMPYLQIREDETFRYLKIETTLLGDFVIVNKPKLLDYQWENSKINYKVRKDYLKKNNLEENEVVLRNYDNYWKELNTTKIKEDFTFVYYEAEIKPDKFSLSTGQAKVSSKSYFYQSLFVLIILIAIVSGFLMHHYYYENVHSFKSILHLYNYNRMMKKAKQNFSKAKAYLSTQNTFEARKAFELTKQSYEQHKTHKKLYHLMRAEHHRSIATKHEKEASYYLLLGNQNKEEQHRRKMSHHIKKSLSHYKEANKL